MEILFRKDRLAKSTIFSLFRPLFSTVLLFLQSKRYANQFSAMFCSWKCVKDNTVDESARIAVLKKYYYFGLKPSYLTITIIIAYCPIKQHGRSIVFAPLVLSQLPEGHVAPTNGRCPVLLVYGLWLDSSLRGTLFPRRLGIRGGDSNTLCSPRYNINIKQLATAVTTI